MTVAPTPVTGPTHAGTPPANATADDLDAPPRRGIHSLRPALRWEDGFVTGNGRHGALSWGQPRDEQVVITHHALVLPNAGTGRLPPRLAGQLPALRALLLAGDSAEALRRSCEGWQEWFPRAFHPAFSITMRAPGDGPITHYRRAVDFRTGLLTTTWEDAAGRWRRTCFVSRAHDLVVLRLQLPPRAIPDTRATHDRGATHDIEVIHEVSLPGAPPDLVTHWHDPEQTGSGLILTLHVDYPDPHAGPNSHDATHGQPSPGQTSPGHPSPGHPSPGHPSGPSHRASGAPAPSGAPGSPDTGRPAPSAGGYASVTRIIADGRHETNGPLTRISGATEVTLLVKLAANLPGPPQIPGQPASGVAGQLAALGDDHDWLLTEHVRVHRACLGRVRLDLGASRQERELPVEELLAGQAAAPGRPLAALLEKLFDSGRYLLLSASGLLPPRLTGLWQGDWHAAWSGAVVSNANLNLQLAGAVTTDVPATVHALAGMIGAQLPDWRLNASRLYGARGVMAPASSDGFSGVACHFWHSYPHHLWTAGADWLAAVLLDHADATGDEGFLRERVLPLLIEIATFYEDFLRPTSVAPGRGTVTFVPSYSPENRPGGWSAAAVNATMDIAAARHALAAAADVCTRLGREQGPGAGAERWLALRERLPHYRINADGALAEWAWPSAGEPLPDTYDHRHVSHLYPVWPLHDITADTEHPPPEPSPGGPSRSEQSPRGPGAKEPTQDEPSLTRPTRDGPSRDGPSRDGLSRDGLSRDGLSLAEAALRALRLRGGENGSAHGVLHAGLAAARLRDAELAGERLAAITGGYFFHGLVSGHYPGPDVYNCDAACCLPGLVAELLVDSAPPRAGRPGWVELLPAVPGYLGAGRVSGLRTLAGVRVELAWDLAAGYASALLCAKEDQQLDLACRRAGECLSRSVMYQKGPHAWRIQLRAGVATRAEMEAHA
jgi:hypothetical protein